MKSSFVILGLFLFCLMLENFFPLRKVQFKKWSRIKDNLMLSILGIPFTRLLAYPLVGKVIELVEQKNWGLFKKLNLNEMLLFAISFLLLDYLIYWWHRLNHRLPFLWRFHQVHHADPEMDASTALRFHFGELILSSVQRTLLVLLFGFSLNVLIVFDLIVTSSALFHHSNLALNKSLEKYLRMIIVTPTFHQNHHSYFQKETDSNFSAIFSVWDRLHRTHTNELKADRITIGLPYVGKLMPGLIYLVAMPVKKLSAWPKKFTSRDL